MFIYLIFQQRRFKTALLFILILFYSTICNSQRNLVPNPSFEVYTNCPNRIIQKINKHLISPYIWYKPDRGGGGYANACANNIDTAFGVPNNYGLYHGYQYARSGNAYIGLFYRNNSAYNYFQVKLLDSLKPLHKYYAEHYVNLENDCQASCNNQGLLFTKTPVYVDTDAMPRIYNLPAIPQIENKLIIQDTLNWVKVAGVFTVQGGEQYLTIGNFRTDATTSYIVFQSTGYGGAVYNVDDVSVYDLDSFRLQADAGRDTVITKGDSAWIGSYTNGIDTLQWLQNGVTVIDSTRPGFWVYPTTNTYYVLTQTVNGYTSRDTVFVNVQPLPVSMLNFECLMLNERQVKVSWQTATEINVSHFNVQRSLDGVTFETVGKVDAKGVGKYSFIDNTNLNGVVYYKLEVVDKNGALSYSEIKEISNIHYQLSIYPNPADNLVSVKADNIKSFIISDATGKVVLEATGNGLKQINTSKLVSGLYIVKSINTNGLQTSSKLIVQH